MNPLQLFRLRSLERTAAMQAAYIAMQNAYIDFLRAQTVYHDVCDRCDACEAAEQFLESPAVVVQDHQAN